MYRHHAHQYQPIDLLEAMLYYHTLRSPLPDYPVTTTNFIFVFQFFRLHSPAFVHNSIKANFHLSHNTETHSSAPATARQVATGQRDQLAISQPSPPQPPPSLIQLRQFATAPSRLAFQLSVMRLPSSYPFAGWQISSQQASIN